jgi:chromosome segregation ATPase
MLQKQLDQSERAQRNLKTQISDIKSGNIQTKLEIQQVQEQQKVLKQELKQALDYNHQMEAKVKKSNAISVDLLKKLQFVDFYVPVRDDKIENHLAEFINTSFFRVELKSLFRREAHGLYSFGTMKVSIMIDGSK